MMTSNLSKLIGLKVLLLKSDGNFVQGLLQETDNFGVTILAELDSEHEIKEKAIVYIPHKNVDMISAREDDNLSKKETTLYQELFGGIV